MKRLGKDTYPPSPTTAQELTSLTKRKKMKRRKRLTPTKKKPTFGDIEIEIPTDPTEPTGNLSDSSYWIYGPPGIGKSTFCSRLGDSLFLNCAGGLRWLKVRQILCPDWPTFKAITRKLRKSKKNYEFIIVDPADFLFDYCLDYVCEMKGYEHPSDAGWSKGWKDLGREWLLEIGNLSLLDKALIFITHESSREITVGAQKLMKTVPSMPKTGYQLLAAITEFILYFGQRRVKNKKGKYVTQRYIRTQPLMEIEAKCREDVALPPTMPMDAIKFKSYFKS